MGASDWQKTTVVLVTTHYKQHKHGKTSRFFFFLLFYNFPLSVKGNVFLKEIPSDFVFFCITSVCLYFVLLPSIRSCIEMSLYTHTRHGRVGSVHVFSDGAVHASFYCWSAHIPYFITVTATLRWEGEAFSSGLACPFRELSATLRGSSPSNLLTALLSNSKKGLASFLFCLPKKPVRHSSCGGDAAKDEKANPSDTQTNFKI